MQTQVKAVIPSQHIPYRSPTPPHDEVDDKYILVSQPCITHLACHLHPGLQGSRRRILAPCTHIVWSKPLTAKVLFCPVLQGSQPSPACSFHKSSTKSTGGIIPAGEHRSTGSKPHPFVTGSGIEPGPPRGDTGDRPPWPRHTQ